MKDKRKHHGTVDESSFEQKICRSAPTTLIVRKDWAYVPGSYGRQTKHGWIQK